MDPEGNDDIHVCQEEVLFLETRDVCSTIMRILNPRP